MQKQHIALILIILLSFVGCQQTESTPDIPTRIATQAEATPTQEGFTATPTQTPRPAGRATLPPTWTATPLPPSPTSTATNTPLPTIEIRNPPEVCGPFGPDTSQIVEEFTLGTSPRIAWRAVEGVELYWVVIFDANFNQIHEHYTPELVYDVPADVFQSAIRYGWEVRPLDAFGIQMCEGRGERLFARP